MLSSFLRTAHTVQLKPISYPSGRALDSHLMSFMDVPQYEHPLLRQTAPLSSADTPPEHPVKECRDYFCAHFTAGAGEIRNRG